MKKVLFIFGVLLILFLCIQVYYRPSNDGYYFYISNGEPFTSKAVKYKMLKERPLFVYATYATSYERDYSLNCVIAKPTLAFGLPVFDMPYIKSSSKYYKLDLMLDNKSAVFDISYMDSYIPEYERNGISYLEASFLFDDKVEEIVHYVHAKLETVNNSNVIYIHTNADRCFIIPVDKDRNLLKDGSISQVSCKYFNETNEGLFPKYSPDWLETLLKTGYRGAFPVLNTVYYLAHQHTITSPVEIVSSHKYNIVSNGSDSLGNIETGYYVGAGDSSCGQLGLNCNLAYVAYNDDVISFDTYPEHFKGIKYYEKEVLPEQLNTYFNGKSCIANNSSYLFKYMSSYNDFISIISNSRYFMNDCFIIDKKTNKILPNYIFNLVNDNYDSINYLGRLYYEKMEKNDDEFNTIVHQLESYQKKGLSDAFYYKLGEELMHREFCIANNRILVKGEYSYFSITTKELQPILDTTSVYYGRL